MKQCKIKPILVIFFHEILKPSLKGEDDSLPYNINIAYEISTPKKMEKKRQANWALEPHQHGKQALDGVSLSIWYLNLVIVRGFFGISAPIQELL